MMDHRAALVLTAFVCVLEAAADWAVTRCGRAYIAAAAILISCVTFVFFAAVIPEVGAPRHSGGRRLCRTRYLQARSSIGFRGVIEVASNVSASSWPLPARQDEVHITKLAPGSSSQTMCRGSEHVQVVGRRGAAHAAAHTVLGLLLLGNVAFSYAWTVRTPPGCSADLPPNVCPSTAPPRLALPQSVPSPPYVNGPRTRGDPVLLPGSPCALVQVEYIIAARDGGPRMLKA